MKASGEGKLRKGKGKLTSRKMPREEQIPPQRLEVHPGKANQKNTVDIKSTGMKLVPAAGLQKM